VKYRCKKCEKGFDVPATIVTNPVVSFPQNAPNAFPWVNVVNPSQTPVNPVVSYNYEVHQPCCPHCYSTDIEEAKQ